MPTVPREDLFVCSDPLPPAIFTQLQELGFEPLGVLWTIQWFIGPHLVWPIPSRVFVSAEPGCFAEIYRYSRGEEPRIVYTTCFSDGAVVQTSNHGLARKIEAADVISQSIVTLDLRQQLDKHLEAVQRLMPGRTLASDQRIETLVAAQQGIARRHPSSSRPAGLALLRAYLPAFAAGAFILFLVDGLSTYALGHPFQIQPSTRAIALLATGVGLVATRRHLKKLFGLWRKHEVDQAVASSPTG